MTKEQFEGVMALPPLYYTIEDVGNDFNFAPHRPFSAESIGTIFLSIYHVFAIIVMLNLLIALMTTIFRKGMILSQLTMKLAILITATRATQCINS